MIPTSVAIHDIRDAEGFVAKTIRNSSLVLSLEEFEELKLEGLCILYTLEKSYQPHMPGYTQPGRFSGYAARFLPGRLQDAWAKQHPEHHCKRHPDGSREWEYGDKNLSLQQDDMPQLVATGYADEQNTIASAISTLPAQHRLLAPKIVKAIEEGYDGNDEIARRVHANRSDVSQIRDALKESINLAYYHAREAA